MADTLESLLEDVEFLRAACRKKQTEVESLRAERDRLAAAAERWLAQRDRLVMETEESEARIRRLEEALEPLLSAAAWAMGELDPRVVAARAALASATGEA